MDNEERLLRTLVTESGFTVKVKPLPPYYLDPIEEAFPLLEMPTRKVRLLAGDVYEEPYEMPAEEPNIEDAEDHDLWLRAKHVLRVNAEQQQKRNKAKRNFLLSTCILIEDGPEAYTDDQWVHEVEAFDPEHYQVPSHPGARRLLFIKLRVLTKVEEVETAIRMATYEEVREQGIASALHGFRDNMVRSAATASNQ